MPQVLGVRELLEEWTAFRVECVRRRTHYDLRKKKEKLHLLLGLQAILLDIDKAVRIVRETEEESEVVPNLMIGFGIDEVQAEYVAEIKAAPFEPGIYFKAHRGDRQPEKGDRRAGRNFGFQIQGEVHHHPGAGGGGEEVRQAPAAP